MKILSYLKNTNSSEWSYLNDQIYLLIELTIFMNFHRIYYLSIKI